MVIDNKEKSIVFLTDFGRSLNPAQEEIARWGRDLAQTKGKLADGQARKKNRQSPK